MNHINYLWQQNNALIYNQLLLNSQNNLTNSNPNTFLQRKRKQDENIIFSEKNPITPFFEIKRGPNFFNNKNSENLEKHFDLLESIKNINDINIDLNKSFINKNFIEKEKRSGNKNNININVNNIVYNILNFNNNNDIIKKNQINENIKNNQLENIKSNKNSYDSNDIIKNKYFKLTKPVLEEKSCNDEIKIEESPNLNYNENNNEVKVLKNNKVVYVNSYLLKSPSTSKNLKKLNKISFIGRSKRSSRFKGVSKNGNQWQVLLMHKKGKSYVGSYISEELAAKIYDILAIKCRGIKARTNFKYNYEQIKKIGDIDFDINSKNLQDIVNKLEL